MNGSDISRALVAICPSAQWVLHGDTIEGLVWLDGEQQRPSDEAIFAAANTPSIPTQVTMRQARLALSEAGLLSAVQAAVDAGDAATKINWEYASTVDRNDALVMALAPAIGLTSTQLDALFTQAASF